MNKTIDNNRENLKIKDYINNYKKRKTIIKRQKKIDKYIDMKNKMKKNN